MAGPEQSDLAMAIDETGKAGGEIATDLTAEAKGAVQDATAPEQSSNDQQLAEDRASAEETQARIDQQENEQSRQQNAPER